MEISFFSKNGLVFSASSSAQRGFLNGWLSAWMMVGGAAVATLGAATAAVMSEHQANAMAAATRATSAVATTASLAPNESVVDGAATASTPPSEQQAGARDDGRPVPRATPPMNERARQPARSSQAQHQRDTSAAPVTVAKAESAQAPTRVAAVCAQCGVVQGVREIAIKGEGTALGAVAGGVIGGVVGHQFGHGNGRSAMTVLGAIGGGLAGNEAEKRARAEKAYDVRVRMDDGSTRVLRQRSAPAPGSRVVIEGDNLRVVRSRAAADSAQDALRAPAAGA